MKKILLATFLFPLWVQAQTAYPLGFYWAGKIDNHREFEMRVNLYESDKLLNGQGSKLTGECIFLPEGLRQSISGEVSKNGDILINCTDTKGKITASFSFPKANGQQKRQKGLWTDGKKQLEVFMDCPSPMDIPATQLTGFCIAINRRMPFIKQQMSHWKQLEAISMTPYDKMNDGYLLNKKTFLKSDYYGADYLEFADSTLMPDSSFLIRQLSWQLLPSSKRSPYILERRQETHLGVISFLDFKVLHFIGDSLIVCDSTHYPKNFRSEANQWKIPNNTSDFFIGRDKVFLFTSDKKQPIVWRWKEDNFSEDK